MDDGSYYIADGEPYGPDSWTWIHMGGFQSDVQSGAFRMPNGNTLITVASDGRIFEVNSDGDVVWDYEHPGNQVMIARADKYSYEYLDAGSIVISGDINQDSMVNVQDVILLVNFILNVMEADEYQLAAADMNNDSLVNITDVILVVNVILGV